MNQAVNRSRESGFGLLLVLMMASIVALMLYQALPRVAFEGQRLKEDLLIQRGEEYKRAIQLYLRKLGRYPASIEQLEETNNMRFLRQRYVDPMTGKDEWRLIHVGPGGIFIDSLTQKFPQVQGVNTSSIGSAQSGFGSAQSGSGSAQSGSGSAQADSALDPDAGQPVPLRWDQRRRQSEGPGGSPMPGDTQDNAQAGGAQQQPEQSPSPQTDVPGGAQVPQTGSQSAQPGQLTSGDPGQAQTPGAANNVLQGIMNGLRGGSPQLGPTDQSGIGGSSPMGGGGIAGVASTSPLAGIKVYNDQKKYKKWEFLYDPRKDLSRLRAAGAAGLPTAPVMGGGIPGLGTGAPGMNSQQVGANPFSSPMQPGGSSPDPTLQPMPQPQ